MSKLIRERSRQEELNDIITSTVNSGNLPKLTYEPGLIGYSDKDLLVSLNDIHYGANIDNYWHKYNSDNHQNYFKTGKNISKQTTC